MVRLLLLSGFLGAGKTTLMTNILDSFADEKIGVIINEFGETGVDGKLLAREGVSMTELSNGSIFCSCIKESFLKSLIDMSKQDITHLFIEPSGLADPSEMDNILQTITPMLDKIYDYRGVVCVIDAENYLKLSDVLPALIRQVEYCSAAVINKADLVDENRLDAIARRINELNPSCEIIITSYCNFDIYALAARLSPVDKAAMPSTNTPESRPCSFVLKPRGDVPVDAIRAFTEELLPHAYRIKGFLPTTNGVITVSAVGGVINIAPWTGDAPAYGLVIISAVGISIISRITDALKGKLNENLGL